MTFVWDLLVPLNGTDLVQRVNLGRQAAVNAEYFIVNDLQ